MGLYWQLSANMDMDTLGIYKARRWWHVCCSGAFRETNDEEMQQQECGADVGL